MKQAFVFILFFSFFLISCDDTSSDNTNNNTNNNNNASCENPGGEAYDYVINEIYIPKSTSEGIGIDFDDNGSIDNKMAALMASLLSQSDEFDMNESIDRSLSNGNIILLGQLMIEDFTGDNEISATLYEGDFTGDSTETMFNGNGNFSQKSGGNSATLCGRIYGAGVLEAGPGDVTINIPVDGGQPLSLHLYYAQLKGMASTDSWTDMVLAGVLLPDELKNGILPQTVANINQYITDHPDDSDYLLSSFDNKCSSDIEGCANNPDCAEDGIITETEFACNSSINTILTPDVTINGVDYVSFAVKLQAVKAIVSSR